MIGGLVWVLKPETVKTFTVKITEPGLSLVKKEADRYM